MLVIVYFVLGLLIALPYCYLAGGMTSGIVINAAMIAPIFCYFLLILVLSSRWLRTTAESRAWWYLRTILLSSYALSPIIMNVMSKALRRMDHGAAGDIIFTYRYATLVAIPILIVLVFALEELISRTKSRLTSSPNVLA